MLRRITLFCALMVSSSAAFGGEWVTDTTGLRNLTINSIAIAPSSPNIIYAQGARVGVYRSIDGGATWSKTQTFNNNNGPGYDHLVHDGLAVHPTDPDVAWAASGGQVYKTVDGGSTWAMSSTGTTISGCDGVHGVVVDPTNPDHLFAGTIISGCSGGVFESTDGGATWTNIAGSDVGGGVGNDAWPIAVDPVSPARLYCGSPHNSVYHSTDGGHHWINSPPVSGDHSTYEVVVNPLLTNEVWCSEVGGTWLSTDYGATWTRQTHLFDNRPIDAMRFAPSSPQIVYAIVGDTVWRSDDNATSFTAMATILGGPRAIEIDPTDPNTVYVGTWGLGMYKSIDGGATFAECNTGLPMTEGLRSWYNFGDPVTPGGMYCVLSGNIMFRRGPDDTTWTYHAKVPDDFVQIERHRPNRWYAAADGLWRSTDFGTSWEEVYSNGVDTSVVDFWLDPVHCGRILLADRDGMRIAESTDGGDTWETLGAVPLVESGMSGVCGDSWDNGLILVAATPGANRWRHRGYIWRSTDRGQTWTHVRDNMFYGDWRIGNGYWLGWFGTMRQEQEWNCGHFLTLDNRIFGNGTFECRVRFVPSNNTNTDNWAGFTIRLPDRDSDFMSAGWLVYLRRNGVAGLHSAETGTVINVDQTPVTDASDYKWNKLKLVAQGNTFTLYVNDTLVGSYTDADANYPSPGYFALQTCKARAEFDNLNIAAESTYTDTFDVDQRYGATYARWLARDPNTPGRFALATQWGGLWQSADYGATWQRVSPDNREGNLFYRPAYSSVFAGNLYAPNGTYYTWRIDNYYNGAEGVQRLGSIMDASSLYVVEDPFDPQRIFASIYGVGPSWYTGGDVIGTPAPPIPLRPDVDGDGDVDQSDFGLLQACYSGPGIPQNDAACAMTFMDGDDDVDADDFVLFSRCFAGADVVPDPACTCSGP